MWLNCLILSLIESVDGLLSLLLNNVLEISCSFISVDSPPPFDSRSVGDLELSCRPLIRSRNDTFSGGFANADKLRPAALVDGVADSFSAAIVDMALNVDDDDDCGCDCDDCTCICKVENEDVEQIKMHMERKGEGDRDGHLVLTFFSQAFLFGFQQFQPLHQR